MASGLRKVAKNVGIVILVILAMAVFVAVLRIAIARENARLVAVQQSQCALYGTEINERAGRDVCPPTVNG